MFLLFRLCTSFFFCLVLENGSSTHRNHYVGRFRKILSSCKSIDWIFLRLIWRFSFFFFRTTTFFEISIFYRVVRSDVLLFNEINIIVVVVHYKSSLLIAIFLFSFLSKRWKVNNYRCREIPLRLLINQLCPFIWCTIREEREDSCNDTYKNKFHRSITNISMLICFLRWICKRNQKRNDFQSKRIHHIDLTDLMFPKIREDEHNPHDVYSDLIRSVEPTIWRYSDRFSIATILDDNLWLNTTKRKISLIFLCEFRFTMLKNFFRFAVPRPTFELPSLSLSKNSNNSFVP